MEKGIELASEQGEILQPRPIHILKGYRREPETEREIFEILPLSDKAVERKLKNYLDTGKKLKGETLICLGRCFASKGHEKILNLIFAILNKQITPTLMNHVARWSKEEQKDHAAEVVANLIETLISRPRDLDYAEFRFNHYLKQRSIDEYRKKRRAIEKDRVQENPRSENDEGEEDANSTVENIADSRPSPETYGAALTAMRNLPADLRKVFFLYHFGDMDQKEIAKDMQVSEKTIRNWLKKAQELLN